MYRIRVYETTVDLPEPDHDGEWYDDGETIEDDVIELELDEYDREDGLTITDLAVTFFVENGMVEPNDTLRPDAYNTVDNDYEAMLEGRWRTYQGFLEGFTDTELDDIYEKIRTK